MAIFRSQPFPLVPIVVLSPLVEMGKIDLLAKSGVLLLAQNGENRNERWALFN